VTLTDTGPLVALIDNRDGYHTKVKEIMKTVRFPLITTEACLTETMHLLYADGGWMAQASLWRLISSGALQITTAPEDAIERVRVFMERFRDIPCDYADATLLVAAEVIGQRRIFTLDRHFYAYRLTDGSALQVIE